MQCVRAILKAVILAPLLEVFCFFSFFVFSHPGRHPGRQTAWEEHSQGEKGVGIREEQTV